MEASPISVKSNDSGYSSSKSDSYSAFDLPCTSYDGSHLHWKSFREHVLEPHRIHIVHTTPNHRIPDSLLSLIGSGIGDASRFDAQRMAFQHQVAAGRGFGPSPLFPPNLLPPLHEGDILDRCMIPSFSRDALPSRLCQHAGPLFELSVPRSNLGCGFSAAAFTPEELSVLPSHLVPTGTTVDFDSGYISPGAAIYCPFLVFERAYGVRERSLEAANNQCAIGGTWCLRALQMLYAKSMHEDTDVESPIAFSCVIDNTFAIINLHWVDSAQTYSMSPLCKFDLDNDVHFMKFVVWVEAIGQWASQKMLPVIKQALHRLLAEEVASSTSSDDGPRTLTLNTARSPNDDLLRSLKTTFDDVPWRLHADDCTPVSSSTASWGSPVTMDLPFVFPPTITTFDTKPRPSGTNLAIHQPRMLLIPESPISPAVRSPVTDTAICKSLSLAMDEIRDLRQQIHILKTNLHNATNTTHSELSAVKVTVASMLRKETLVSRNRSISTAGAAGLGLNLASSTEVWYHGQTYVLPSTPRLIPNLSSSSPISPIVPSLTSPPTVTNPLESPNQARPTPLMLSWSTDTPNASSKPPNAPALPSLPSPEPSPGPMSALPTSRTLVPPTPYTPWVVPPPPDSTNSLVKWSALTFSAHVAASFIPVVSLRIVVLGIVTEAALLGFSSPHYGASWEWMMRLTQRE